jgi:hypothetical protein
MKRAPVERHPNLFEDDSPQIIMPRDQKQDLVRLIRTMLIEIVTTMSVPMTAQEGDDDKDYA